MGVKPEHWYEAQVASVGLACQQQYRQDGRRTHLRRMRGAKSCHQCRKRKHWAWETQPVDSVSIFWESFTTGRNYARMDCPPEPLRWRFAFPTTPPGTYSSWKPETQSFPQGQKTAEEKPYIISFRDFLQNMALLNTFAYLQIQPRSAGFIFRGLTFVSADHHHLPQGTWLLNTSRKQASRCQHIKQKWKTTQSEHRTVLPWACPDVYYHYSSRLCSSWTADRKSPLPWGNRFLLYWCCHFVEFCIRYFEIFTNQVR